MDHEDETSARELGASGAAGEEASGEETPSAEQGPNAEHTPSGGQSPSGESPGTAVAVDTMRRSAEGALLPGTRMALVAACAVIVILGMKLGAAVVAPVILAFVVTVAISPFMEWLRRKGLSTMTAYVVTLVVTALIGSSIIIALSASLASFALGLPDYADEMQPFWDSAVRFFDTLGIDLESLFSLKEVDPKAVVDAAVTIVGSLTNLLSSLGLVALIAAFMLIESTTIPRKIEAGMVGRALGAVGRLTTELRRFVKVTAYLGAVAAILETVLLLALGVPNAILWGILSFFFSFVPYVGFLLALIPPTLLALLTGGWVPALIVLAGYVLINTVSDNVVKPHMMGTETDLSPLAVFLSLVLWGWVLGPLGALLAVPVTLIVKRLVLDVYPEWHWAAVLLGSAPEDAEN